LWVVIDSCIDSTTGEPASLSYLEEIGYHPPDAVKLIVATHWHDDHVAGLSKVVGICENAPFCCSSALAGTEFLTLIEALNNRPLTAAGSRVRELYNITRILEGRNKPRRLAAPNRPVLRVSASETGHGSAATVHTLSPSDKQISNFHAEIGEIIENSAKTRRVRDTSPNHLSVAALVEIGPFALLAGADLEETGDPLVGWSAVVASAERPQRKALIYKVAHHGSLTGHHAGIWTDLLEPKPQSVISPWNRSARLPKDTDIERVALLSDSLYLTSTTTIARSSKRLAASVERQIRALGVKLMRAEPRTGAVRFRGDPNWPISKFSVETRGDAYRIAA
jgi:hypothetical protein